MQRTIGTENSCQTVDGGVTLETVRWIGAPGSPEPDGKVDHPHRTSYPNPSQEEICVWTQFMKREAWGHRKYAKLARCLGIDESWAVGIVESLWRCTDQEAPAGDIGKLSNEDIACAIHCSLDADRLVEALISARWLDRHPRFRLVIHDWPEHCEDAIHRRLARSHLFFTDGSRPHLERLEKRYRAECEEFYRNNPRGVGADYAPVGAESAPICACPALPCPALPTTTEQFPDTQPVRNPPTPKTNGVCVSNRNGNGSPKANGVSHRFDEFWERYPHKVGKNFAAQLWVSVVTAENEALVFDCLSRYESSDMWARKVFENPAKWLQDRKSEGWEDIPAQSKAAESNARLSQIALEELP